MRPFIPLNKDNITTAITVHIAKFLIKSLIYSFLRIILFLRRIFVNQLTPLILYQSLNSIQIRYTSLLFFLEEGGLKTLILLKLLFNVFNVTSKLLPKKYFIINVPLGFNLNRQNPSMFNAMSEKLL